MLPRRQWGVRIDSPRKALGSGVMTDSRGLTFDLSGGPRAQPVDCPIEGRIRPHSATFPTGLSNDRAHGEYEECEAYCTNDKESC